MATLENSKIELDAVELCSSVSVTVVLKHAKQMRLRLWIAAKLLKVAAFVGNFNVEITNA